MSWAEVKKLNSDLSTPLNKQHKLSRTITFTMSGNFTVPRTGKYRITAIGKGGNGGYGNSQASNPASGGGGGAGAIAISELNLTQNDSVAITVSETLSSFGAYLTANAGSNGVSAVIGGQHAPGNGGTASGGNLLNANGNPGYAYNGGSTGLTTFAGRARVGNASGGSGYFPWDVPTGLPTGGANNGGVGTFGGGNGGNNDAVGGQGGPGGAAFGAGGAGGVGVAANGSTWLAGGGGGIGAVIIEYWEELNE